MKIKEELKALFGLSMGHFNIDLYAALLVPLYPLFTIKLGINLAIISSVIALGHLVSSMMQPLFGYIADKLKHRLFMVLGLVLSSIFIPLTIKAANVLVFALFLMLGMLGNAFFHPQVSALIKDFNKNNPNVTYAMGVFLAFGTFGYAIGPYVSTLTVQNFGQNAFIYLSLIGLISVAIIYFVVPKMPDKDCYIKENFFKIIKEILKNKPCMFLMLISIIKSAVSISFGTYIPFLLSGHGFNLTQTGFIVTLFFIFGGIATILSSRLEKRMGAKRVIAISFLMILPLIIAFILSLNHFKYLATTLFILTGFFISLSVGIILVHAQKAMPKYLGVISGVMQGFSWGIGALFLAPLGLIGQSFGIVTVLILMASAAFAIGLFTCFSKFLNEVN